MKLDKSGYLLITNFEGFSAKPYRDSIGIPTIGYGNTFYPDGMKVSIDDKSISLDYAKRIFEIIADEFSTKVNRIVTVKINQNQFNAIVSLAYNIGVTNFRNSTLLKKLNLNPNDESIHNEFLKWNKSGGKILKGLINRRKKESELYFTKP